MIYLQLLWVYLKIGMFGFGGGYAMLSLIQHEIVDIHHWLTPQQFTDVVAISQMTPGPIGINSATYVGYAAGWERFWRNGGKPHEFGPPRWEYLRLRRCEAGLLCESEPPGYAGRDSPGSPGPWAGV